MQHCPASSSSSSSASALYVCMHVCAGALGWPQPTSTTATPAFPTTPVACKHTFTVDQASPPPAAAEAAGPACLPQSLKAIECPNPFSSVVYNTFAAIQPSTSTRARQGNCSSAKPVSARIRTAVAVLATHLHHPYSLPCLPCRLLTPASPCCPMLSSS